MNNNNRKSLLTLDCAYCGDVAEAVCADCMRVAYCSEECQSEHWQEEHKLHHIQDNFTVVVGDNYQVDFVDDDGEVFYLPTPEAIERRAGRQKKWIKKAIKHPGSFSAAARRHHMTTAEYATSVLKKGSHASAHTKRQARFYRVLKGLPRHHGPRRRRK